MPNTPPKAKAQQRGARGSTAGNVSVSASFENGTKTEVCRGRPGDGTPGPGRPPGRLNDSTIEVKKLARGLVDDPQYREALRLRLVGGDLAPAVECLLWHYAYGKPKETVAVEVTRGPVALPEKRPLAEWQEAFGEVVVPRNGNGHREGVN